MLILNNNIFLTIYIYTMGRRGLKKNYSRKRRTKRRKKRTKRRRKRRRRKSNKKGNKNRKRRRTRRRRQRGGGTLGNCKNVFQGNAAVSGGRGNYQPYEPISRPMGTAINSRQLTGQKGGSIWRDLGLNLPRELYNDGIDYLKNSKNTYIGDRQDLTSNVLKQPIGKQENPRINPLNYGQFFKDAESTVADLVDPP